MHTPLVAWLHILLVTVGILASPDLLSLGGATGGLAIAAIVLASAVVLIAVQSHTRANSGADSPPHPERAIDDSRPLLQSDPDAPGHPRPRAPQWPAAAA